MTTNWRSTIGYGFKIDTSFSSNDDVYDEFIDDIDSALSQRYPLLAMGYAGSAFSGDGAESWVFLKSSVISLRDDWSVSINPDEMKKNLDEESLDQLYLFVAETGIAVGSPAWKLLMDVG